MSGGRIDPGPGYAFAFGPGPIFDSVHADGRALGLRDALDACHGVRFARIYRPDGSLLMGDAGDCMTRRLELERRRYALAMRRYERRAREVTS